MTVIEQQASNDWGIADIISYLAPHLPDDLKSRALHAARTLNDPGARVSAKWNDRGGGHSRPGRSPNHRAEHRKPMAQGARIDRDRSPAG